MMLVGGATILASHYGLPYDVGVNGEMILSTTVWYFFVLLNAYYGGALTMFFTSTITIPFESVFDVLRAHPNWKMIYQSGEEAFFTLQAQHDPDYARYVCF